MNSQTAHISATQVTTGTAARLLKVSPDTINRLCEEGLVRAWRLTDRGWWRIDYASLLGYLSERRDSQVRLFR